MFIKDVYMILYHEINNAGNNLQACEQNSHISSV